VKQIFGNLGKFGASALLAAVCAVAAYGQQGQEEPSSVDTFAIPDNITILGNNELGERRATAIVNGTIITRATSNSAWRWCWPRTTPSRSPKTNSSACVCRSCAT
jgi:hypothetical protein